MSFRCQKCKKQQEPGRPQVTVVTEWRERRHFNEETRRETVGREIVTAIKCCQECANKHDVAVKAGVVSDASAPLSSNVIGQELVAMMERTEQPTTEAPVTAKKKLRRKASPKAEET
jgi:hypothetical protein